MIEYKRLDEDVKRNDIVLKGLDIKTLTENKFKGEAHVVLPNRGVFGKDTPKVTVYLDLGGLSMIALYNAAFEQFKTRATQDMVKNMSEKDRAKTMKDGYIVVRVADWYAEKQISKTADPMAKAIAAANKLSPEELALFKARFTADESDES